MQLCKCRLTKLVRLMGFTGVNFTLPTFTRYSSLYIDTALSTTHASPLRVFFTCRSAEYLLVQVKMHRSRQCSICTTDRMSSSLMRWRCVAITLNNITYMYMHTPVITLISHYQSQPLDRLTLPLTLFLSSP